jgi:GST-like protein
MGQIPAIIDTDGPGGATVALGESSAILRYLARKTGRLLPEGPLAEMEADRWTAITAGGLQAAPTTIFFARALGAERHEAIIAKQHEVIGRYLDAMEKHLAASVYLAGDHYCYADILGFTIANRTLPTFGISLDPYPAIRAWKDGIAARPAVQRGVAVPG